MSEPASTAIADGDTTTAPVGSWNGDTWWQRWRGQFVRPVLIVVAAGLLYLYVQSQTPLDSIEARSINRDALERAFAQHVRLSLTATIGVVLVAVPLGMLLTRRFARPILPIGLALGNLGQAIPSIGLIVLLALWIDIGFWVACLALVIYSVLPVLRNTIAGLQGVDVVLKEAASGMGMSRWMILRKVELPLAVPVILAGIRTALVLTFATAVLATFINAGGLGDGLVAGIKLNRPVLTVTYGVLAALLTLFADWVGGVIEQLLRPKGI
ncbi:MAG: ABC transporter permease [Humibacillus sp.]|nr:ABC transporter permease [Humibacillus sp.]